MRTHNLTINWNCEFEYANRGLFSLDKYQNLILSFSQENTEAFHTGSKIVTISGGKSTEIFETALLLGRPVVDDTDFIYVCSNDYVRDGKEERGILQKLNSEGKIIWEYYLDAPTKTVPVVFQNSVFVFDFSGKEQKGHLHRVNENGNLQWKLAFNGNAFIEPQIFNLHGQDVILIHAFDDIFILSVEGRILQNKSIGRPYHGLWVNEEGYIFVAQYPNLLCLNTNLEIIWTYKPDTGFAKVPRTDIQGNLFSMLTDRRIVSLDSRGTERWITTVTGEFGRYPIILSNGDILMETEQKSGKEAPQVEDNTYLEIFSNNGTKLLTHEFVGGGANAALAMGETIYLVNHCRRLLSSKHQITNSIQVFSICIL